MFNPRSGDTHLLSTFAASILECLGSDQALDPLTLAFHRADWFEPDVTEPERRQYIHATLLELQRLGLIHTDHTCTSIP